jgi:hypothetical protein
VNHSVVYGRIFEGDTQNMQLASGKISLRLLQSPPRSFLVTVLFGAVLVTKRPSRSRATA